MWIALFATVAALSLALCLAAIVMQTQEEVVEYPMAMYATVRLDSAGIVAKVFDALGKDVRVYPDSLSVRKTGLAGSQKAFLMFGMICSESVREHQTGLQSFRSMRRIDARRKNASAL